MLHDQILEANHFIHSRWPRSPEVGIILGTGLGDELPGEMKVDLEISYQQIPYFVASTVASHAGKLVCGYLGGKPVVAMQGRIHYYEGYTMQQITFPVRVMKSLGCHTLVITNAAGGMNPQFNKGDIMVIEDQINLMGDNPLIGPNDPKLGDRFPDMTEPYTKSLIQLARQVAREQKIATQQGVFVAVTGPNLETRAEYRFLRMIGADAVGMSTVPEVIVAVHGKMKVLGFSVMTDMCLPDALHPVSLEEIVAVANGAAKGLSTLIRETVARM